MNEPDFGAIQLLCKMNMFFVQYAKLEINVWRSYCFHTFLQGPELLSKYVGESERAVREVRTFDLAYFMIIKKISSQKMLD